MSRSIRLFILFLVSLAFLALLVPLFANPSQALASFSGSACVAPAGLQDYVRWFGSQHSHSDMDHDDGAAGSTAATAFAYAKNIPHLQYFIITSHIHSPRSGSETLLYNSTYNTNRSSANSATTPYFVAIAGQEVSIISTGGHRNLYNASALVGVDHPNGDWNDADDYYDHVAGLGSPGEDIAAQFNHPEIGDFGDRYDAAASPYFGTIAVSSGPAFTTTINFSADGDNDSYQARWAHLLSQGWKLSPSADQDNHGATWGASTSEYTVIVRPKGTVLTRPNVLKGLRGHCTYATEDPNMQIGFLANGWSMGQTIGGSTNISFTVWWNYPSQTICNNNVPVCVAEHADDLVKNIKIYKNSFDSGDLVAAHYPDTTSGVWETSVSATTGDWFVIKFQDTFTLASPGRTYDQTWSGPVWYDPANADPQDCLANIIFLPFTRR